MKIERSDKEYGCGTGHRIYESEIFKVSFWKHYKETKTTIEFEEFYGELEVKLDGRHEFKSDDECMDQLTTSEILHYIQLCKKHSFIEGRNSIRKEFNSIMVTEY